MSIINTIANEYRHNISQKQQQVQTEKLKHLSNMFHDKNKLNLNTKN